ncbi:Hypothetical predicted protein [Podarcis lilfordi]|uniref:Uncharacterized protein n=1 Tax=Podarcis lilfordi TaxID=74358 RepID=A0AA35JTQ2_9SAUR|nr:Hypothetical predicted protein [Podarcis lilfordi]
MGKQDSPNHFVYLFNRRLLGISHCVTDSHALNDKLALKCRWLTLQLMLHKLSTEAA